VDAHRYPRPQLERTDWTNLNGSWRFKTDNQCRWTLPSQVDWDTTTILVPFSPETPASGVAHTEFIKSCWYQKRIDKPESAENQRVVLHFGAVDWKASVWVNDKLAVVHEGGYTPFFADITDLLTSSGEQVITVRAEDDPLDFALPRGKQDWLPESHSIWYPRTTGIWQTVWLEVISPSAIAKLQWSCNRVHWSIGLNVVIEGCDGNDFLLNVKLRLKDRLLVNDTYAVIDGTVSRELRLPDPGIDSARDEYLWCPETPNLLTAELALHNSSGEVVDHVYSYTAMRSVEVDQHHFLLNGKPYQLRMVLDQGYWPQTGLTSPDDAALRQDVELVKLMKFNAVRKHQKIEDPRFLYWADYMGLLVWEEMPSAYSFSSRAVQRLASTWIEVLERDRSHPCIIAWVPFNESWGTPDLPASSAQRDYLRSIYYLTKALDGSRPVIGNDGWEMVTTDIIAVHDYADANGLQKRFLVGRDRLAETLDSERPGDRILLLDGLKHSGKPVMLTEFGGICLSEDEGAWGYRTVNSAEELAARYGELLGVVHSLKIFSGFCYTQLTDTYQEANGLLYMDRTAKFPLHQIAQATSGRMPALDSKQSEPKT
jgi:beta-galactosidase/beta-glucuronidase